MCLNLERSMYSAISSTLACIRRGGWEGRRGAGIRPELREGSLQATAAFKWRGAWWPRQALLPATDAETDPVRQRAGLSVTVSKACPRLGTPPVNQSHSPLCHPLGQPTPCCPCPPALQRTQPAWAFYPTGTCCGSYHLQAQKEGPHQSEHLAVIMQSPAGGNE
jgi:hypothetical protein